MTHVRFAAREILEVFASVLADTIECAFRNVVVT